MVDLSSDQGGCPFCRIARDQDNRRLLFANDQAYVIRDGFPVTPGHTLIIVRRHVSSFFELTEEERSAIISLLDQAKVDIETHYHPDGYNIGINDGSAAGQTVPHLHVHLIPRYFEADCDPRGGVRWVVPEKADYWSTR